MGSEAGCDLGAWLAGQACRGPERGTRSYRSHRVRIASGGISSFGQVGEVWVCSLPTRRTLQVCYGSWCHGVTLSVAAAERTGNAEKVFSYG